MKIQPSFFGKIVRQFLHVFKPCSFSFCSVLVLSTESSIINLHSFLILFSEMDSFLLDYTDVQLKVAVSGPGPSTMKHLLLSSTTTSHMLTPMLTANNRGLQCFKLNGNHTENDRFWQKNNFLLFAKCLKMYIFFAFAFKVYKKC